MSYPSILGWALVMKRLYQMYLSCLVQGKFCSNDSPTDNFCLLQSKVVIAYGLVIHIHIAFLEVFLQQVCGFGSQIYFTLKYDMINWATLIANRCMSMLTFACPWNESPLNPLTLDGNIAPFPVTFSLVCPAIEPLPLLIFTGLSIKTF